MEENKTTEFVKDVTAVITGIELETNPKDRNEIKEVERIRFVTDKGDITFKPKIDKEVYQDGMKIISKEFIKTNEVPEQIKAVAKAIQSNGSVKMIVSYSLMTAFVDGEEKKYRFFTSMKTFNDWKVVPKEEKVC